MSEEVMSEVEEQFEEATTDEVVEETNDEEAAPAPKKGKKSKKSAKPAKKAAKKAPAKKSAKPAKKAAKKAPAKKSEASGPRKVGVIDTILVTMQRADGATTGEMLEALTKKFKDRDPKKMMSTIQHQVRELPGKYNFEMKKTRVEGRGLVYKAPARIAGFKPEV